MIRLGREVETTYTRKADFAMTVFRRSLILTATLLVFACQDSLQEPGSYIGRLNQLIPIPNHSMMSGISLISVSQEQGETWKIDSGSETAHTGEIRVPGLDPLIAVVLELRQGAPQLLVDLNLNATFDDQERFSLEPSAKEVQPIPGLGPIVNLGETTLSIPMEEGPFSEFPLLVRFAKARPAADNEATPLTLLQWNTLASLQGSVDVDGKTYPLALGFSPSSLNLDPRSGAMGIDSDGDGKVNMGFTSPEWAIAKDESVVFRVGQRFLSFQEIDLAAGRVVLSAREEADYRRIELIKDVQVPDFEFVDFEGRKRRLSDFEEKYVLLDFWGSWCGPCIREFPDLAENYAKFRERGFEILGMDADPDPTALREGASPEDFAQGLEKARAVAEKYTVTWTHARTQSIADLITQQFRIVGFPTAVLLDPDRRIVMADEKAQPLLRGAELEKTLDRILPPAAVESGQ